MKKTKIIATVWPVTESEEQLKALNDAWVNIIRFNFSHADYETATKIADRIKKLNSEWKTNLSLLLDTKWPEIRTGDLNEKIAYKTWDIFEIVVDNSKREGNSLFCDYPYLVEDIEIGSNIAIDSGLFDVKVIEKKSDRVIVEALNDALIWSRRHINLPWLKLRLPWVTEKDREDIIFAIKNDFHFIAASFIRSSSNVEEIREIFREFWNENIKIISKIENLEWVENMEEIAIASDWIMIARWDLWIEIPIEKLAIYQREIIANCRKYGKISVIATHLLETMIENPSPTRAESSDVFNSAMAKPDCLMLSWETTIGKFPIKAVETMTRIIIEAEKYNTYAYEDFTDNTLSKRNLEKKVILKHALMTAEEVWAKTLVIFTKRWLLARLVSAFKPSFLVYAFTPNKTSLYFMNILFAIKAVFLDSWNSENYEDNLENAISYLKEYQKIQSWDTIIAVNDIQKNNKEYPLMQIISVE